MNEIILKPIGIIRNEIKDSGFVFNTEDKSLDNLLDNFQDRLAAIKAKQDKIKNAISEIIIDPCWEELLDGIEENSHILVLFWGHKIPDESRKLKKIHPMRIKEIPQKGIFATCSPTRPNPVLVSVVKLLERNGNILKVEGLEAFNETPIIDIKPYSKGYYRPEDFKMPDWMEDIHKKLGE